MDEKRTIKSTKMDEKSTMIDEKRTIMYEKSTIMVEITHEKSTILVEITHEKSTILDEKRPYLFGKLVVSTSPDNGEAIMHIIGLIPGIGGFGTGQKLYPSHTSM